VGSKTLIVTADDFGGSLPVNEAVETAARVGVLTAASLMMAGSAVADAVERAHRLPNLRVGLHLVLVRGKPILPPSEIPDLVNEVGLLRRNLATVGTRIFFSARAKQQAEAEIRAQFAAFLATGLSLDHVNAHNHYHLHPTILSLILKVGKDHGVKAVRVPYEPPFRAWRATGEGLAARMATAFFLGPWCALTVWRLRRAGIAVNDRVFGLFDTGRMDGTRLRAYGAALPDGVTEIFVHPAMADDWPGHEAEAHGFRHRAEFDALVDPRTRAQFVAQGLRLSGFTDMEGEA
jgi:hopanoid biosynthesis associated protein HpnK